jgi:hypothetical protein
LIYFIFTKNYISHEWGASMLAWQKNMKQSKEAGTDGQNGGTTVSTIDLAKHVLEQVASRQLPAGTSTDRESLRRGLT